MHKGNAFYRYMQECTGKCIRNAYLRAIKRNAAGRENAYCKCYSEMLTWKCMKQIACGEVHMVRYAVLIFKCMQLKENIRHVVKINCSQKIPF